MAIFGPKPLESCLKGAPYDRLDSYCCLHFYSKFVDLKKSEKRYISVFNNIDPYVCKNLGYYVYEAFHLREFYSMKQKHEK